MKRRNEGEERNLVIKVGIEKIIVRGRK